MLIYRPLLFARAEKEGLAKVTFGTQLISNVVNMARVTLLTYHVGTLQAKLQRLEVGSSTHWHRKAALESLKCTVEQ